MTSECLNQAAYKTISSWESLEITHEYLPAIPSYDAIICYGQGPVIDTATKKKAIDVQANDQLVTEEINSWGRTIAVAAGYLQYIGSAREMFFSGGKTGGSEYKAEAELMYEGMQQVFHFTNDKLPPDTVHTDSATNTLENMALTLNQIDRLKHPHQRMFESFMLLGSQFHAPRIRILAGLFNMKNITLLSSERVVEAMIHDFNIPEGTIDRAATYLMPDRDENTDSREAIRNWLEARTDPTRIDLNRSGTGDFKSYVGGGSHINERTRAYTFAEKQQELYPGSVEAVDYMDKARSEAMFSQGLITIPQNWLGYLGLIEDNHRLFEALKNIDRWNREFLRQVGVSLPLSLDDTAAFETTRTTLMPYRTAPPNGKRVYVSLAYADPLEGYKHATTTPAIDRLLTHLGTAGYCD